MQTNTVNAEGLADLLAQSQILDTTDLAGVRQYTLEFDGQDIFAFAGSSGEAFIVYPPESFDAESGGSAHDHCRACLDA